MLVVLAGEGEVGESQIRMAEAGVRAGLLAARSDPKGDGEGDRVPFQGLGWPVGGLGGFAKAVVCPRLQVPVTGSAGEREDLLVVFGALIGPAEAGVSGAEVVQDVGSPARLPISRKCRRACW
jgi:hypothetical protein